MSHELRTPMIGILGYSETLMQEASDDEVKNTMEIIYRSASRLMDTLNLILHLSRIEAGKLDIEYTEFDVIKSIKDIFKLFAKLAEQKSLYLKLESEYSQLTIVSDAKLLREIISNLVNNGIKFTERGGVVVSVTAERTGSAKWLVLRISDTGMGIAKENQELIWEEFRQVSEGHNRSFEGTGLGLTITKRFVDKLKGSIVLESELHKGSVFILRFPLLAVNSSADTPEREATVVEVETPLRTNELPVILYVEDDVIAAQLVTKILRSICKVEVVATASAAIKRASEAHYAAILMDINLGRGEDGVQATKAIRQLQAYKNTPIVALTAYVMEGDKEEFLQAGCSHYLSKPFVSSELKSLMNSILPT
jgi:CheY-like chemotaxis protein